MHIEKVPKTPKEIDRDRFVEAAGNGSTRYESVLPCKHHGKVERYIKNKGCVVCAQASSAIQYLNRDRKFKRRMYRVHDDDVALVELFINQLLEARGWKKP
jgi:flavodoxin